MPKCHLDTESLQTLYEDFSKEKDLVSALMRRPEYIAVIRLSMGRSQTAFENLLSMSKNLYKYESGKIKPTEKTAKKFLSHFRALEPWEVVLQNFEKLSSESRGWFAANSKSLRAMRARKKGAASQMKVRMPTSQESEVASLFDTKDVRYRKNFEVGRVFVDFYIPKLEFALECKRLTTRNRREHMKKVKEAAFQGYKVKFYEKSVKLAVVIESQLGLNANERQELCGPYDFVFEKVERLKDIIKDQSA